MEQLNVKYAQDRFINKSTINDLTGCPPAKIYAINTKRMVLWQQVQSKCAWSAPFCVQFHNTNKLWFNAKYKRFNQVEYNLIC